MVGSVPDPKAGGPRGSGVSVWVGDACSLGPPGVRGGSEGLGLSMMYETGRYVVLGWVQL